MQNQEIQPYVLIAVPTLDTIKTETVSSLFGAVAMLNARAKLHIHVSSLIHDARNKCVDAAIAAGATHLMFIDSDMKFPPEAIQKLINQDKDIIGGLYYRKQPPHFPLIHEKDGNRIVIPRSFNKKEPFKVFGTGTGFMLIKTKVFKKLEPPWFYFGNFKGKAIGEDIYFCKKAQEKGFEVWCDPTLGLQHMGIYPFDEKDYEAYEETRPKGSVEDLWQNEV